MDAVPHAPRVLVVDDNPSFLRVVRAVLETRHPPFTVDAVGTGEAALAIAGHEDAARRPDFVVLDFHLPDLDAPEVLARLRRAPGGAELPVLVLTQADWRDDESAALAAGARDFRAKPSTLAELRAVVVDFWREHVRSA